MVASAPAHGLNLPIYGPETPVATTDDLKRPMRLHELTDGGQANTLVRAVEITLFDSDKAPQGLDQLLEKTDAELERAAQLCGSLVVDYNWGLYPISHDRERYAGYLPDRHTRQAVTLPEHHILVAEVAFLKGAIQYMPRDRRAEVAHGAQQFHRQNLGQYALYDVGPRQFLIENDDSPTEKGTWLVDIEPRFKVISPEDV